jgi:hypothetical protein
MINIVMTVKTIHIIQKGLEIYPDPGHDRVGLDVQKVPTLFAIATELVESGELPRYVGTEMVTVREEDRDIFTTQFVTREGAEKWAEWVRNDKYRLISISVVED